MLAMGFVMAGCSSNDDTTTETPPVDNRGDVVGTYPVKISVSGKMMQEELYTNLTLAKEGDENLKASASVSVEEMGGDIDISLVLSSLKEYTPETRALPTGYSFKIAEQEISVVDSKVALKGTGQYDNYDGRVYKTGTESFISFELASAGDVVTVKIESATVIDDDKVLKFDDFAGEFYGDIFRYNSSYVCMWFYNGMIDPETGPTGSYELLWVEAFDEFAEDFEGYPGLKDGTYLPDADYEGAAFSYIMGDPTDGKGNLTAEDPYRGTFYRKVDDEGNTTAYFFTSGTITIAGNTMMAKLSGFELDLTKPDGRGEDVIDMEFKFEGSMGKDKFTDGTNTGGPDPEVYTFPELVFTAYYGDFEIDGSGKFIINLSNGKSSMKGRIGVSITGYMTPEATFEENGWVYPETGTYNVSDSKSPMTLIPGEVDMQKQLATGTYFYRLDEHGAGLGSALAIDGGSITITDTGEINESTGKKVFRIDFNLTSTQTAEGIDNIDKYSFEGPLWYINQMPANTYSVPEIGAVSIWFNGNIGANGAGWGQLNIEGIPHPDTGNPQYFAMKMGIFFEAQPDKNSGEPIIWTPGNYSFSDSRAAMTASIGTYTETSVATSGAFIKETNGMGNETLNWIALEGGTIKVTHNKDANYTIEYVGVYGKDIKTWYPRTNINFSWTGDIEIWDWR